MSRFLAEISTVPPVPASIIDITEALFRGPQEPLVGLTTPGAHPVSPLTKPPHKKPALDPVLA